MSMTTISLHDVVSVTRRRGYAIDDGTWVRTIEVKDKRGHIFHIDLYADSAGTLALNLEERTEEELAREEVPA